MRFVALRVQGRVVAVPLVALLAELAAACSNTAPRPVVTTTPTASASASSEPTSASISTGTGPASLRTKWRMLPSAAWHVRDRIKLPSGGELFVGDGGERWVVEKGVFTAAEDLAADDLRAVRPTKDGLAFLHVTGALSTASTAIGPFISSRAAPGKVRSATAAKSAFMVVTQDDKLLRTVDGGSTWTAATLPVIPGRLLDVAFSPTGEGLLMAFPERIFGSTDDGASFVRLPRTRIGMDHLSVLSNDRATVVGTKLQTSTSGGLVTKTDYLAMNGASWSSTSGSPSALSLPITPDEAMMDWAGAADTAHGILLGKTWFEVITRNGDDGSEEVLAQHELGGATKFTKIAGLAAPKECNETLLGGSLTATGTGRTLVVGCVPVDTTSQIELLRSDNDGATWTNIGKLEWETGPSRHIRVSPKGLVHVSGGCLPKTPDCGLSITLRTSEGTWIRAKAPRTDYTVHKLGANGDSLFLLVNDAEDSNLRLLISTDGGRSFKEQKLPAFGEDDFATDAQELLVEGDRIVILAQGSEPLRFVSTDGGKTFRVTPSNLPSNAQVTLAGARGFAFDGEKALETFDHGETFRPVVLPPLRSPNPTVTCSSEGCILGATAERLGWTYDKPSTWADAPAFSNKTATPLKKVPVGRKRISCEVGPPVALGHSIGSRGPLLVADPQGKEHWLTVKEDDGAISVVTPTKDVALLTKNKSLAAATSTTFAHIERSGVSALRFGFVRGTAKGSIVEKQAIDVEVAFYVASTGKVHHAVIKAAGELQSRHLSGLSGAHPTVKSEMFLLPGRGLFVRPLMGDKQPLYLVSEAGKVEKLPIGIAFPNTNANHLEAISFGKDVLFLGERGNSGRARDMFVGILHDDGKYESMLLGGFPDVGDRDRSALLRPTMFGGEPHLAVSWPGDAPKTDGTFLMPVAETSKLDTREVPGWSSIPDPLVGCVGVLDEAHVELTWVPGQRTLVTAVAAAIPGVRSASKRDFPTFEAITRVGKLGDKLKSCVRSVRFGGPYAASGAAHPGVLTVEGPAITGVLVDARYVAGNTDRTLTRLTCKSSDDALPPVAAAFRGFTLP